MIFKDKGLTKYDKIFDGDSNVSSNIPHKPVMLQEVLHYLDPKNGETYIDCTFGAGGYTSAILESYECNVIGIDQDLSVIKFAEKIRERFKERFTFIGCRDPSNFNLDSIILTWTPKPEPMLMRASPPARLGKEKPHESQTPQPRSQRLLRRSTDHPQVAHR